MYNCMYANMNVHVYIGVVEGVGEKRTGLGS